MIIFLRIYTISLMIITILLNIYHLIVKETKTERLAGFISMLLHIPILIYCIIGG